MKRSFFIPISALWLLTSGFSPAILDENGNGLSDFWEKEHNAGELFPEAFDPQANYDADDWNNMEEAAAGTAPYDANPPDGLICPITGRVPAVIGEQNGVPVIITPEVITVSWPTLAGKQYTLKFSPDLTLGSWVSVGDPFIATGGEVTYNFEIDDADKRFWRVAVTDADTDGDGLNNHEENQSGSNPAITDTDDDGLSDREEAEFGTNPNNPDSDNDSTSDGDEIDQNTDPNNSNDFPVLMISMARGALGGDDPDDDLPEVQTSGHSVWRYLSDGERDSHAYFEYDSPHILSQMLTDLGNVAYSELPEKNTNPFFESEDLVATSNYFNQVIYGFAPDGHENNEVELNQSAIWIEAPPSPVEYERTFLKVTESSIYVDDYENIDPESGEYIEVEREQRVEMVTITTAPNDRFSERYDLTFPADMAVDELGGRVQEIATRLLPLEMSISHPELDGEDPPEYVVNADVAETLITVGLTPAGDGSIIEWEIEEGDGSLSVSESTTTDGFASTTLTTSTNAGDTYKVKARIKKLVITPAGANTPAVEFDFSTSAYANLTGIEQTTDVITVIPGYAASITVQREPSEEGGSTTDIPADGESEMTFVATVHDQFGQPVATDTPVVWHLGGLGSIEPETPATDSSGIARAKVVAGDASSTQTVRIEVDGFEVTETLENSAVTGSISAGATTLDIATSATTTLTAAFPDVADGAAIRWYASRGEIINAASTVEGGQATATLRAGGGRIGNAMVTASVGGTTHALEIDFVSTSPITVEVEHPVIVGDETTAGAANVPQIDGTSQSVAYQTSTPVTIKAPAYAGHTATVHFGSMASGIVARLPFDEINGAITPDGIGSHNATIQGAVLDINHRHEGVASLYFDGASSSLAIADHADLRIQDGLSMSAWVHAASSAGTIISKPGEYRIFIDGQGRVVFGVTTTAGEQLLVGPALPLNRWCRISASHEESGIITISLDGMKATSQIAGNLTPGTNAITIGASFEGWLDLLEISLGKQFISGTGLDVTGLSGGQVVLDGNGEAVVNLSSGAQSVVSAASPVQGIAIRVSINPEVKLEDVVVVATKDAYTVIAAAMGDMKVTTASQASNLSGTIREDVVARNLLEFASTGQRSTALPFVPAGNITDRLRYAHRATLWLGETVGAAQDVRDILENSHPLDLPADRKYHLSDQTRILLMESIRGGSDSGANQYLDDAYGGLVGTLAGLSGQANFKHLTTLVDGGTAFGDMGIVHENHGAELIEDIAILAEHEAADPTFCQRILANIRSVNDVISGQWQQTIFDNTEDFIRKYCQQGVNGSDLTASEAFDIGFGWGLAAEFQAMSQTPNPLNPLASKRMAEQMATTVMLAIKGDENTRKGLMEAIPLWGLKVMNDEANNLVEQGEYFDAGMKSAQLSVAAVSTGTAAYGIVGGMVKGGVTMARAAKNVTKPIKGVPPPSPASFGLSKSLNPTHATLVTEFKNAHPFLKLPGAPKINLHHAVPKTILKRRKHLLAEGEVISEREMHSLANARGVPYDLRLPNGSRLHQHITNAWERWFDIKEANSLRVTRQQLFDFAGLIDNKYGHLFIPPIR